MLYFLALGAPLALALHAVHFSKAASAWTAAGTFIGFLWVVALWEEFLFRGVLQQWLEEWMFRLRPRPERSPWRLRRRYSAWRTCGSAAFPTGNGR